MAIDFSCVTDIIAIQAINDARMLKSGTRFCVPDLFETNVWSNFEDSLRKNIGKKFNGFVKLSYSSVIKDLQSKKSSCEEYEKL